MTHENISEYHRKIILFFLADQFALDVETKWELANLYL